MECTGKLHLVDLAGSECAKTAGQEDPKVCYIEKFVMLRGGVLVLGSASVIIYVYIYMI